MRKPMNQQSGFSLIELSLVLIVMGLMLQASVGPLGQRIEHQRRLDAQTQLEQVQMHLKAHWVSHARLPCPLPANALKPLQTLAQNQAHNETTSGCGQSYGGVPASQLGIVGPINRSGALLDPWNNPLHYRVSFVDVDAADNPNSPDWVSAETLSTINFMHLEADLSICRDALTGSCSRANDAAADIVAVVVSGGGRHTEREQDNRDNDEHFISASYSSAANYAFDDQLIWLGRSEMIYLALQAGWLP